MGLVTAGNRVNPIATADIIAVGSELLTPTRLDTNSLFITGRLNELGIDVRTKTVVGDEPDRLGQVFRQACDRSDLVVLTGGLGPTNDDVTREVVADALGLRLVEDPALLAGIERRFASRGWRMPAINRRQAMVPEEAVPLHNSNGTAPGLWIDRGDAAVLLLPGPPRELQPMLDAVLKDQLAARAGSRRLVRRVLRVTGRPESGVEELTHPVYSAWERGAPPVRTTILASPGQIELHLTAEAPTLEAAEDALDRCTNEVAAVLGHDLFSTDGRTLEDVVGGLLEFRGMRVAVAESCTGGLVCSRLTDVPGSSRYVERGVVAYSNAAKTALLGVEVTLLDAHGAVSEPVALAMAAGVLERAGVELGIGITGIAGPGGGTPEKPVGTVVIALAGEGEPVARTFHFLGDRAQVKRQAGQSALDLLRRRLMALTGEES